MTPLKKTAIAMAVAQLAVLSTGAAFAQTTTNTDQAPLDESKVVVVSGQRAALQSAQKIKQDADEVVDSIVADDIGKLPDRSVTEVLQRVVGVSIDRTMAKGDPEHYSVEGSGVTIRGLSYVRSELNGRDSFSANGGRSLNFEDVPPELMAGVDVYKNPSAEQIEGGIGGLVNLRTAMPFDYKGFKGAVSVQDTYSTLKKGKPSPSSSLMFSNRWNTGIGEVGALIDLAYSESATRTDAIQVNPYYPRTDIVEGKTVYVPNGIQWRTLEFNRKREGAYGALQWRPSRDITTALTFFKSRYNLRWDEQAIFQQSSPYNMNVGSDATYDAAGNILTGTLTNTKDGGINMLTDTRTATRRSDTTEAAWNIQWRVTPALTLKSDLQRIRATTDSFDSTVALGMQIQKSYIDLTGSTPRIALDAADTARLTDPANYYWASTMEHLDKSEANETAWKLDGKYDFDHPVLRDFRFGVRLTQRDSLNTNSNPSYNWSAITQPWQVGWDVSGLAYLSDPRFAGAAAAHTFSNFFGGSASVPSAVLPDVGIATGYPATYAQLHTYHDILCQEQAAKQGWSTGCAAWKAAAFGTDPAGVNDQSEKTKAIYGQLRFGFDDLKYPIDGNLGLRYVKTDMTAHGYTVFTSSRPVIPPGYSVVGSPIPDIADFAQKQDFDNSYHNVLPSLNLRFKVTDKLQFRLAFAQAISRPDFSQLQAYTGLGQSVDSTSNATTNTVTVNSISQTGAASGNPMLTPVKANQIDFTGEWYFAPAGSFTFAIFNKRLRDIIINQLYNFQLTDVNGTPQNFTVTGPVNGAKGHARGIELAYQQYFDKLPGWASGIGVQANYTYVSSHQQLYKPVYQAYCTGGSGAANLNLNLNGCDTNGQTFGDLPLQGLSKNAFNLALMYDKGPVSARLAYNWRSKSLQGVNVSGTNGTDGTDSNPASATYGQQNVAWGLPTWADSYGQLDASIFYKINDNLSFGLEAQNLNDATFKQLMDQHSGMKGRAWFSSGPRYTAQLRYTF